MSELPTSTGPTPSADGDFEVFLGVDDATSERRLSEWLESMDCRVRHGLAGERAAGETALATSTDVDLLLVDPPTLRETADAIEAAIEAASPTYLPLGVLVSERGTAPDATTVLDRLEAADLPAPDEAFVLPVGKREFARRLRVLMRARRLSVELAATGRQYERLVELVPEAVLVVRGGEIRYANDVAAALFDADGELTGTSLERFVAPDERSSLRTVLAAVGGDGDPYEQLDFLVDGDRVHAEVAGVAVSYAGERATQLVIRDVTDRTRRERQLRLYQQAMDEAGIGITIADARAGDEPLIYANEHFERLTGYPIEEVLGRNCRFLQGPNTDPRPVREMREAIDAGQPVSVELRNYRKDGTPFWNEVTITPVRDGEGEVTHYVGFQRDVTGRKQREQRLSVLDRVLRHNLRNAMTVIEGHAAAIADRHDDAATADHVAAIRQTADELLSISDAVRRFSQLMSEDGDGETGRVDLADAIAEACDRARDENPDAAVSADAPESVTAIAHPALRSALAELIDAAARTSGTVAVDATRADDGRIVLTVGDLGEAAPEYQDLVVGDDPESSLEHLSGVALWLVKWSVEASGGEIAFERDGETTVVEARLPAADGAGE